MPRLNVRWPSLAYLALPLLLSLTVAAQGYAATEPVLLKPVSGAQLTSVDGTLFFIAPFERQLWRSDGTSAGTILLGQFRDYPGRGTPVNPRYLTSFHRTLFFAASDGISGQELWKSDGTVAGTSLFDDIEPGSSSSYARNLASVDGTLFFAAGDVDAQALWKSDGTPAGTTFIREFGRGGEVLCAGPYDLTGVNHTLFFGAADATHGTELWKSDGTATGTTVLTNLRPTGVCTVSHPINLTSVGSNLFFNFGGLWKSDGTVAGTTLLGPRGEDLTDVNGKLFYLSCELWTSDGTVAGTRQLKDIDPGPTCSDPGLHPHNEDFPSEWVNVNGKLFFQVTDGVHGNELWKSDGTEAGTSLVKDINPGSAGSEPSELTDVHGNLYFTADDGIHGTELWRSDGSSAGTVLVKDLDPGSSAASPSWLTSVNGKLFFEAYNGTQYGLWVLGPQREDYKNAAQFCKAERDFLGEPQFGAKYGANGSDANANGKCVSQNH